jgi:photosystem II stability/assembly factor-like uncharacterized protein
MKSVIILTTISLFFIACSEPSISILPIDTVTPLSSVRGLYSVSEAITWSSGTNGVIKVTTNNNDWVSYIDTNWNQLDFRDIHAFSDKEAIIMSSGDGCEIYKTTDMNKSWQLVYENKTPGIFFDGMDFWDDKNGIAFSDPINNQLFIITTKDGGANWQELKALQLPNTLVGEASFAASGTSIVCVGDSTVFIGTGGGSIARVFKSTKKGSTWEVINTKMKAGEASGIYSMTFIDELNGVAVGGNYLDSTNIIGNCVITKDSGKTWNRPKTPPFGYRSCVAANSTGILICCGRTGVDVSYDKGNTWKHISDEGYYSCVLNESSGWLFGKNKRAKLIIN